MKLTIVIPCYNERHTIRSIVEAVRAAPVADKEIIIVDDCSTDGTREILRSEIEPLVSKVVYHPVNAGKGAALRTGGQPRDAAWVRTEEQLAMEILRAEPWTYARIHLRATLNTLMPDTGVLSLLGLSPGSQGMLERIRKVGFVAAGREYLSRNPNAALYLVLSALVLAGSLAAAAAGVVLVSRQADIGTGLLLVSLIVGLLLVAGLAAVPRFRVPVWPAVCLLAGAGAAWAGAALQARWRRLARNDAR